jgi:hypothetical protein
MIIPKDCEHIFELTSHVIASAILLAVHLAAGTVLEVERFNEHSAHVDLLFVVVLRTFSSGVHGHAMRGADLRPAVATGKDVLVAFVACVVEVSAVASRIQATLEVGILRQHSSESQAFDAVSLLARVRKQPKRVLAVSSPLAQRLAQDLRRTEDVCSQALGSRLRTRLLYSFCWQPTLHSNQGRRWPDARAQ